MKTTRLCTLFFATLCLVFAQSAPAKKKGQMSEEERAALEQTPIAVVDGQPFVMVTIVDTVGDFDAMRAPTRERLLKRAFDEAVKNSKLNYAYNLSFRPRKPQQFIPELYIEIYDWKFVGSGAFECTVDALFYDALRNRHDLKGAIGVESTLSMAGGVPAETEIYLQASAEKAFVTILNRVLKRGLYRDDFYEPSLPPEETEGQEE